MKWTANKNCLKRPHHLSDEASNTGQ